MRMNRVRETTIVVHRLWRVHVRVYELVHTCVHARAHERVHVLVHIFLCKNRCQKTHSPPFVYTGVYIPMYTNVYAVVYTGVYTHLYTRVCICVYNIIPPRWSGRYTFAADIISRITPEEGAAVRDVKRTFVADFDRFISLQFPAKDDATIETVSLGVVKYWLPPVKWVTSRINLAVLAGKAFPALRRTLRTRRGGSQKVGPDSMVESKLPYIYDPQPERAAELPLRDQRDDRGTIIDVSLTRPRTFVLLRT